VRRRDAAALCALGIAGFWLRAQAAGFKYLENDEAFSLFVAGRQTLGSALRVVFEGDPTQSFLCHVLDFFLFRVTPDFAWLRLIPTLWGMGAVALSYLLGRAMHSRALGWFWACLMSVSVFQIHYSTNLRLYAMTEFLSLWNILAGLRLLQGPGGFRSFAASAVLLQLVYPFGWVQASVGGAFAAVDRPEMRRKLACLLACVLLIPAVWILAFGRGVLARPEGMAGLAVFRRIFQGFGPSALWILCLLGTAAGLRSRGWRRDSLLAVVVMVALPLVVLPSLWKAGQSPEPRHIIPIHPLFLGFAAAGLLALASALSRSTLALVLATVLVLAGSLDPLLAFRGRQEAPHAMMREAARFLGDSIGPGDAVVLSNPNSGAVFLRYYDRAAFDGLEGVRMGRGIGFFIFPDGLKAAGNPVFTLNPADPSTATLDQASFLELRRRGVKLWFIHLPFNFLPDERPFYSLLAGQAIRLTQRAPGIYSE
jgi:uncharacterized membrane protein